MLYPETIFVKILLPTKPYLTREKSMVRVPAEKGPYMILPRRAPTMMLLKNGVIGLYETTDSEPEEYFISQGIVKVRDNACSILVNRILPVADADLNSVKNEIKTLKETFEKDNAMHADDSYPHDYRTALQSGQLSFLNMIEGYLEKTGA